MAIQPDHILLWRQGSNIKGEHQASLCSKSGARACASVVRICRLLERVRFAKSETLQQRPADLAFSLEDLVEMRAVEAITLGESDLRAGAFNRGLEQLTNFIVVEYPRLRPQIADDRDQIFRDQPEIVLSCSHVAIPGHEWGRSHARQRARAAFNGSADVSPHSRPAMKLIPQTRTSQFSCCSKRLSLL